MKRNIRVKTFCYPDDQAEIVATGIQRGLEDLGFKLKNQDICYRSNQSALISQYYNHSSDEDMAD